MTPEPAVADPGGPWPRRAPGERVSVLAHRGGAGPWRENTVEAFAAALAGGADGVELDVRLSGDGRLVVHHDPEIPGVGPVHALSVADLPPWVPTLEDALAACAGAAVNIEVKNGPDEPGYDPDQAVVSRLAEVLGRGEADEPGPSAIVVSSFWPATAAAVRRADPDLGMGLLVHPALDVDYALRAATELGCVAVHLHHSQVRRGVVIRAHDGDMAVVTWTVNDHDDVDAVVESGVDVVITDQVESTLAALGRG